MTTIYNAQWIVPVSTEPFAEGGIAVSDSRIVAVSTRETLGQQFPQAEVRDFGPAAIIPGLVNSHSHLELTAMRGFLENEENDFFAWLKKLTIARLERMTADDLNVSAQWGLCEAARAGVTCVADASDAAFESMNALRAVGLRGLVFQESFGPDPRLAQENFAKLQTKITRLRELETALVKCGVSPHAPYTVCGPQLEMIAQFTLAEELPLMMHAAETLMEVALLREGSGALADGLKNRGIDWQTPGLSTIQYLKQRGILATRPLLAHCIHVDGADIETLGETGSKIAHCPKSNSKLSHGVAPLPKFLKQGIATGLGSDSVASNNVCDLFEEARYALLLARSGSAWKNPDTVLSVHDVLQLATRGGATALGMSEHVGALREGMQADFAIVSLNGVHQIPVYDPVSALIFSSSARDVVLTVVAGREVYRDGRVTNVDEDRLRARMKEISEKLSA
ncbi:MAG: 5-methylthioadenosine/S-adenosylhomocysteine deaminase [Pyrinomonadaceae bacterium]|jgi:5-methylthioadenosine/S-adenosylhomocysteine deaminase|nr:5-methylthioadenosine/S-adenosylhomocysteine deaminase [Pyrinomonadaceae bacterium]